MKSARRFVIAVIITTALILGTSGSALASDAGSGPDAHASCAGILTWANTHHVEGFPTRAEISHLVKTFTTALGLPPGAFFSFVAGSHEGSISACDAIVPH